MQRWLSSSKRLTVFALASAFGLAAAATPFKTEHVTAELVAQRQGVQPGKSITIGLRLQHAPQWHTYWRNPGDSGLPTTLELQLPPGAAAGPIDWPAPQRIPVGPLLNYGYEGEVLLPLSFTAPPDARPGEVLQLRAEATWLVCKDVCIPENASLALALPVAVAPAAPSATAALFERTATSQAAPLQAWKADVQRSGRDVLLTLSRPDTAAAPAAALPIDVFPYAGQVLEPARQTLFRTANGYAVQMHLADSAEIAAALDGIAVAPTVGLWGAKRVVEFHAPVRDVAAIALPAGAVPLDANATLAATMPATAGTSGDAGGITSEGSGAVGAPVGLMAALALALFGGMVLNLMPCVFPVLSIKLLSLARYAGDRRALTTHALAYAAGVLTTFVTLAAMLLALRATGSAIGWGFQLQEPGVVFVLALLFFGLGLNLMNAFEFRGIVPQRLACWRAERPAVDAFAGGAVAVIAASPCTAPFMGAALGFAITQPTPIALAVFATLGLGMALPYVLLVAAPGWRSLLPRPGAWMNRIKQGFAFPMFATVIWLLWVLGQQTGLDGVAKALLALLGVAFFAWASCATANGGRGARIGRALGLAAVVALLAWSWPGAPDAPAASVASDAAGESARGWQPYDEAAIERRVAEGKPIFVDFTAAWCVSCQVNKRLVLHRDETMQAFARAGVTLMRADWTHRDPSITAALARLGRNGVPVYVLIRPGRAPLLLPEILTGKLVRDALATL